MTPHRDPAQPPPCVGIVTVKLTFLDDTREEGNRRNTYGCARVTDLRTSHVAVSATRSAAGAHITEIATPDESGRKGERARFSANRAFISDERTLQFNRTAESDSEHQAGCGSFTGQILAMGCCPGHSPLDMFFLLNVFCRNH